MPGTKFSYGNKLSGIKGLRTKILAPALTSHYEVEIPVGSGTLNTLLTDIATFGNRWSKNTKHILF